MTKTQYSLIVLVICAMLPLAAVSPYLFYGRGFKVIAWVWDSGYWPFWLNLTIGLVSGTACAFFLLQFNALGRLIFSASSILITAISALFAMSEHRHSLLVVVFVLAAALVWTSEWLRKVLDLPFYNSRRNWWEAHPKAVPGVTAKAYDKQDGSVCEEARVANFGETGCFLFLLHKHWDFAPGFVELNFQNGRSLAVKVVPVLFTGDRNGVGLRFDRLPHQDDWHQDLQDYLNGLRRSGYVSG